MLGYAIKVLHSEVDILFKSECGDGKILTRRFEFISAGGNYHELQITK